jgi:arabinofuranosyltransferase
LRADRAYRFAQLVALALLAVVLVRCAWQSDDAYITYRTVWNWFHGYGLRWNPLERVQAYTHPLWMLSAALSFGLTGEIYFSTLALSWGLSLASALLLARRAPVPVYGLLAVLFLLASRAWIDFAVSGLETPLLVLLVVLFVQLARSPGGDRRTLRLALLASLIGLTRLDAMLLVAPALLGTARGRPLRGMAGRIALGMTPLVAWHLFSLVYYGFLFPNTAYAKLNVGVPLRELFLRGVVYLSDSLQHDPLTLLLPLVAVQQAHRSGEKVDKDLAAGIALYLLYILRIGGDFMAGRFLVAPFTVGILLLDLAKAWRRPMVAWVAVALSIALVLAPPSRVWSGAGYGNDAAAEDHVRATGIADERAFYYPSTGLLNVWRQRENLEASGEPLPPHPFAFAGRAAASEGNRAVPVAEAGLFGYFAGPDVHVVDLFALADPLLARLPFDPRIGWRVGHYVRHVPRGYGRSVVGDNQLADPRVHEYYDVLRLITRAPLASEERWKAIVRMQLGLGPKPPPLDYY